MEKGKGIYNVVVIGAGTAGLVTAAGTAGLGGRVALIERARMGGDCLNTGCVPSKALIATSRRIYAIRTAPLLGLNEIEPSFDFKTVMDRMRSRRAVIEPHDSQERFEGLGIDVFRGDASFIDAHSVKVGDDILRARNFVIATGGRAAVPPIEGINDVPYHTNETIFDELHDQPARLAVIGGGPIGTELSQVFSRLGTQVTLFEAGPVILSKEDADVGEFAQDVLKEEGITIHDDTRVTKASRSDRGAIQLEYETNPNGVGRLEVDAILVAAGRQPNIETLNLDKIDVQTNRSGVMVNARLQTTQPHIYAAGDVAGSYQFTHWADAQARIVIRNILMPSWLPFLHGKIDDRVVPWCTYIEPEVASVGLNETRAKEKGIAYDLWQLDMKTMDRAIVSDETQGFVKVLTKKGTDQLLGVNIVGHHAGELIHEFVLAMQCNIGLAKLSSTIHAYPTMAEIAKRLGDQFNKTKLSPTVSKVFGWMYRRAIRNMK
jgi:pyruvate/2-oxoglutarate dehydrogenase complex dihydrolipoamide dehydrogenase (E3) component